MAVHPCTAGTPDLIRGSLNVLFLLFSDTDYLKVDYTSTNPHTQDVFIKSLVDLRTLFPIELGNYTNREGRGLAVFRVTSTGYLNK